MTRGLFEVSRTKGRFASWVATALAAVLIAGCEAHTEVHGHLVEAADVEKLTIGESSRKNIERILGKPSFEGAFDSGKIYYLGDVMRQPAGGLKQTESRTLLVLTLDGDNILRELEIRDETSGRVIAYLDEKSPTPGERLTGIEQIFANLRVGANQ